MTDRILVEVVDQFAAHLVGELTKMLRNADLFGPPVEAKPLPVRSVGERPRCDRCGCKAHPGVLAASEVSG